MLKNIIKLIIKLKNQFKFLSYHSIGDKMYDRNPKKVVIDSGHGGNDPGSIGNNLIEKDLNLKAAQYMYKRLKELGIPATLVKNTDETLDREERIKRILNAYGNSPDVILVSNHINAGGGKQPLSEVGLQSDLRHI